MTPRTPKMLLGAFDLGMTHFDLANNYGPPPGAAEELLGRFLHRELAEHRDELVVSPKAGYRMWPGPYGDGGSREYLLSSLDQSLRRLELDYVDIFYHHRPDAETPIEETMGALERGQSLAQLALLSVLRQPALTSVVVCASRLAKVRDSVGALQGQEPSPAELARIDAILG